MKPISWQRWAATFAILLFLSFLADYFFLHILFDPSQMRHPPMDPTNAVGEPLNSGTATPDATATPSSTPAATGENGAANGDTTKDTGEDNFLKTLQDCRSEVSSQGITTPEALMTYLEQSIGKNTETVEVENFILTLPDGSERRVHIVPADNTNSKDRLELRYFSVDAEGYPQRIELTPEQKQMDLETLKNSLLAQGRLQRHEVKKTVNLRDGSFLNLESHNDQVFEFQWRGSNPEDPTLSCRHHTCVCKM